MTQSITQCTQWRNPRTQPCAEPAVARINTVCSCCGSGSDTLCRKHLDFWVNHPDSMSCWDCQLPMVIGEAVPL